MNLKEKKIIVAGGAIGGATVALLLARAGATVTILERVSRPRAVGAGIALAPNGLAVLESLGLKEKLASRGCQVNGARIVDGEGRPLLEPSGPQPELMMLRRSHLQNVLLDAVAALPRIDLQLGVAVTGADRDGSVVVQREGGEERLEADLVIGADGLHSRIREAGDFGAVVSPPGIPYVRALVAGGLARNEEAWTSAGLFGSFPVDDGTYIFASATSAGCRAAVEAKDLDGFRETWARAYPPAAELLAGVEKWEDLLVNHVTRVDCRRWVDGRLALLGDAAHAMPPNLGQGANSALVDAAILLEELRRASDMASGLAAYEERRRPAVRRVADAAARLGSLAELTSPALRWLRDRIVMPVANRFVGTDSGVAILQESPETLLAIGRA